MELPASGTLYWDTAEATAPRWFLVLERQSGQAPLLLDLRDPSTPHDASESQLADLIDGALLQETGQRPAQVMLTLVEPGKRYRFRVMY